METIYNKLVRDNIPQIISKDNGCIPYTRVLSDIEYKEELEKKLYEEYQEFLNATTSENRIEELADIFEILVSLAELDNKTISDIEQEANVKKLKRGGFSKKIFLEKVINPNE